MATSKPAPLTSVVASARRITSETIDRKRFRVEGWQNDAWDMYDLVGEQRFLTTTLANRVAQGRLYVGHLPDALTNAPVEVVPPVETVSDTDVNLDDAADELEGDEQAPPPPVEDDLPEGQTIPPEVLVKVLETVGGSPNGRAMLLNRLALNLWVAGDGWLVGIPRELIDEDEENPYEPDPDADIALEDLEWRMLSVNEVKSTNSSDTVVISLDADTELEVSPDDIYLIRVWRSHPNRAWEADSPTRSSLPVLRELVGLTMHVSAQVDSRLAGAGVFIVPQSAQSAMRQAAGLPAVPTDQDEQDPFTEALIQAMVTPISDRSNASAYVPLVITVPDESADKFKHITFSTELDGEARELRDEAIRRLALGQDAPPEILLGTGGMNHWGAWLVQEDVVTTHISPTLALICDALTTQYLWPVLEAMGYDRDIVRQYIIWFDVEHMIIRPNRAADAEKLFAAGAISASSYRDAAGFDDSDAPSAEIEAAQEEASQGELDEEAMKKQAGLKAIDLAIANPELVIRPGLQSIAQQVFDVMMGEFSAADDDAARAAEQGTTEPPPEPVATDEEGEPEEGGPIPDTADEEARPTGLAAELAALVPATRKSKVWGIYEDGKVHA